MAVARPDHTTRGSYAGITVAAGAMDESAAAALSKATASTEKVAMAAVVTACPAKRGPFVVHVLAHCSSLQHACSCHSGCCFGWEWVDRPSWSPADHVSARCAPHGQARAHEDGVRPHSVVLATRPVSAVHGAVQCCPPARACVWWHMCAVPARTCVHVCSISTCVLSCAYLWPCASVCPLDLRDKRSAHAAAHTAATSHLMRCNRLQFSLRDTSASKPHCLSNMLAHSRMRTRALAHTHVHGARQGTTRSSRALPILHHPLPRASSTCPRVCLAQSTPTQTTLQCCHTLLSQWKSK
jgi:hypothetical protein